MATCSFPLQINASFRKPSVSRGFDHLKASLSPTVKPSSEEMKKMPTKADVSAVKNAPIRKLLDAFVDSAFQFVDIPRLPLQRNFTPVQEVGEPVEVACIEGEIPADFPEGVYIRNGANPQFGSLKSTVSMFGRSNQIWVEGEGMLHAVYFRRNDSQNWNISYNNRYVETNTFKLQKKEKKRTFLPALEGDSMAIIAAFVLNTLRFGSVNGYMSSANVFEHAGKLYAVSDNNVPQEVDIFTLETYDDWNVNGDWNRPFTSHPKKAPESGELVIMGAEPKKPYLLLGVISADGTTLCHKVDLKLNRSIYAHELGVTQKYNVIMDSPLTFDFKRLLSGGQFMKYEKEGFARIGVMPRYGNSDSVKWFEVEPHCTFHLVNCFEDGDEVVVRGCRALQSLIPGPDAGQDRFEWFSRGFNFTEYTGENCNSSMQDGYLFSRLYEWRLNMITGEVKERNLSGTDLSLDYPVINEIYIGQKHKYGYTQVVDSVASSNAGLPKYGGLAKLYLDEPVPKSSEGGETNQLIQVKNPKFAENHFCSGAVFVAKPGGSKEDDGWLVSFVHDEETDVSQVHIIDVTKFESKPVAIITLPQQVPYGSHGTFVPLPLHS